MSWLPAAMALMAGDILAQELLWSITGVPGRQIGSFHAAGIGDINHDGYEDLAAIVDGKCGLGSTGEYLWFLSGRDGSLIREFRANWLTGTWGGYFWRVGSAGDWNDDGTPDYSAVGYSCDIRSGVDDSVLFVPQWCGTEVLADLDIDGDGLEDYVSGGWQYAGGFGEVRAYNHFGAHLYTLTGGTSGGHSLAIANELATLGDVDGDGCDDFVMGCFEPTGVGAAAVVSGRTGQYVQVCYGIYPGGGIGYVVDSCGDLDGDGLTDFIAGNFGTVFVPVGIVTAFSSGTGAVLRQIIDPLHHDFSKSIAGRGVDLDGDAVPDMVIGAPNFFTGTNATGAVFAHSGRDGSQLHLMNQPHVGSVPSAVGYWATNLKAPAGEHTGFSVVQDRSCCPVTFLTPGGWCGHPLGSIRAYRGTPRTAEVLGPSCLGTLSAAPDIGMRTIQGGVRVHLARAPASVGAVLMLGLSTTQHAGVPLPIALDPLGFPGCMLRTSIEVFYVTNTGAVGIDAGYAYVDLPYPVPVTGMGTWSLSAQWLVLGPGSTFPGGLTQAIRWRR